MGLNSKNTRIRKKFCGVGAFWSLFLVTVLIFILCWKRDPLESAINSAMSSLKHKRLARQLGELKEQESSQPMKILYTITSLAEYNTGARATVKGSDRLQETLIPVIAEGVQSMLEFGYHVDVFIVSHYFMRPERLQLLRDSLPESVGLEYWDDAMPLGYDTGVYKPNDGKSRVVERNLSLARQHRFVVRDHLMEYDLFVNFEDDMLIKGDQIKHFVEVTEEIYRLKEGAPDDLPGNPDRTFYHSSFHGPMTKGQLNRMIPGFIRVEVLLEKETQSQTKVSPVPIDLTFDTPDGPRTRAIDPVPCCRISEKHSSPKRPTDPEQEQVMFWETDILALGVREMPDPNDEASFMDWVALLRGPTHDGEMEPNTIIGDFWSGTNGYFEGKKRPGGNARHFINNQGGWMATRRQIWDWHTAICPGGFLPPYEGPHFNYDGLDLRDVEWWSGGLHLATKRHACNLQRVISMKPEHFDKHFLYHTANNKQTQLGLERFTKASDLLGQLNTVRKDAEKAIRKAASE